MDVSSLILVCGSRKYKDRDKVFSTLDALWEQHRFTGLVHGACGWDLDDPSTCFLEKLRRADALADEWALRNMDKLKMIYRCPTSWTSLGLKAGPIRNKKMLEGYRPFLVVAFDASGPGTSGMLELARLAGVERLVY